MILREKKAGKSPGCIAMQLLACMVFILLVSCKSQQKNIAGKNSSHVEVGSFKPGEVWNDVDGNIINVHGGGIVYADHKYYWFGEKRGMRGK